MEIPVINRMTDQFEAASINPATIISRIFSLFELGKLSLPHRVFKWGALFLALVYAVSSIAYRIKFLFLHYHNKSKSLLSSASEPLLSHFDDEFSTSCSEDDDVSSSDDDDVSDDEDDEDEGPTSSYFDDFRVKGGGLCNLSNFRIRRRRSTVFDNFSLSDLVSGNGVVKLWENSILGEIEMPVNGLSPAVKMSAGEYEGGGVLGLGLWDLRMGLKSPVVQAQWKVGRENNRVVGDLRKLDTPFEDLTAFEEADLDTWWDADAVNVTAESTK